MFFLSTVELDKYDIFCVHLCAVLSVRTYVHTQMYTLEKEENI